MVSKYTYCADARFPGRCSGDCVAKSVLSGGFPEMGNQKKARSPNQEVCQRRSAEVL